MKNDGEDLEGLARRLEEHLVPEDFTFHSKLKILWEPLNFTNFTLNSNFVIAFRTGTS